MNDYLARRDSEWVGQVHRFLGLRVGLVQTALGEAERQDAYRADVTYVTNSELGFDYLRDNLASVRRARSLWRPCSCISPCVSCLRQTVQAWFELHAHRGSAGACIAAWVNGWGTTQFVMISRL